MSLFGYSDKDLDQARADGHRNGYRDALQQVMTALDHKVLQNNLAADRWRPFFASDLARDILLRWEDLQRELIILQRERDTYRHWEDAVKTQRERANQAEDAEQVQHERADRAEAEVTRLKARLAAEQRLHQAEVMERDQKTADLNRMLARFHLAHIGESRDDDDD